MTATGGPHRQAARRPEIKSVVFDVRLRQPVTSIEGPSRHRRDPLLAPSGEHVQQGADRSLSAPQDMKWTFDLSTGRLVGFIHFQVDVRAGPKILRGGGLAGERWARVSVARRSLQEIANAFCDLAGMRF
jgi:hypothetical protein